MDESDALLAPETDSAPVQEALFAQQRLLQQLYSELDMEREASSSAASEALSMILRLQGEKASLKMEASQYKRMAEEKMYHAEEALDSFEDLIFQRGLEIASLEFQVQAYRYRLLSMGCSDLGDYENKFPENLLMQGNETVFAESRSNNNMRSLKSLPQLFGKDNNNKKNTIERKRSAADLFPSTMDENASYEANDLTKKAGTSGGGDLNSYWEQIKKLDERVKEISEGKDTGRKKVSLFKGGTWSPSLFSQVAVDLPADWDQLKPRETAQEKLPFTDFSRSSSLHDIFEVPQIIEVDNSFESQKKDHQKLVLEDHNRLRKPDSVSDDILESNIGGTPGSLKAMLVSSSHEKKLPKLRDGMSGGHNLPPKVNVGGSHTEYQRLSKRIEKLERERRNLRQEITDEGEVEVILLKGIHEQLIAIRAEMQSWKAKKWSWFPDEPPLDPLRDAMLYFWC